MEYIIVSILGYLLGSSSMAFYLGKLKKVDIRKHGSGNLGASNTAVTLGWTAAVLVGAHDIGKGMLAVILARLVFPEMELIGAVAGVACVLGHIFPFYLGFHGGKGLAAFLGMTIALDWRLALAAVIVLALVTLISNFIALGTLSVAFVVPMGLGIVTQSIWPPVIVLIATVVMFYKHMDNLRRISNGTEIGLRSTIKGENRVK